MALDNLPSISTNHRFLGSSIKHCGGASCFTVMYNYLDIILNFGYGVKFMHSYLTESSTLWLQNRATPLSECTPILGHFSLGFSHPNPQRSKFAPDLRQKNDTRSTDKQAKEVANKTPVRPWLIRNAKIISPTGVENALQARVDHSTAKGADHNLWLKKCKEKNSDQFGP